MKIQWYQYENLDNAFHIKTDVHLVISKQLSVHCFISHHLITLILLSRLSLKQTLLDLRIL